MKAVDTNILARFILDDHAQQAQQAIELLSSPVWIASTVWLELGWVLSKRLRLDREKVAHGLDTLLALNTVHVADRDGMRWAVERFRQGADWADMIHLLAVRDVADAFVTFDQKLGSAAAANTPVMVETLS